MRADGWAKGRTDMTKIIVAFRNLRTRLKKESYIIFYVKEICDDGGSNWSRVTFNTVIQIV
jgi:hypothetical protein